MTKPDERSISPDERVYAAIHDAVQEHRLEPGLKLKEADLTALFKVSRTSVRTALLRLSQKGLLEMVPNRGAKVARPSAEDGRQILESRLAVEGMVIEILARAPRPAAVKALRRHVLLQRRAFEAGRLQEGHRLAIAFHRLLASHCDNRVLAQMLNDLLSRMPLVLLTLGPRHVAGDGTHADHEHLVEAIAAADVVRARSVLRQHLEALQDQLDFDVQAAQKSLRELLTA